MWGQDWTKAAMDKNKTKTTLDENIFTKRSKFQLCSGWTGKFYNLIIPIDREMSIEGRWMATLQEIITHMSA
jgi:hypothetical protein